MIDLNATSCVHVICNKSKANIQVWIRSMFSFSLLVLLFSFHLAHWPPQFFSFPPLAPAKERAWTDTTVERSLWFCEKKSKCAFLTPTALSQSGIDSQVLRQLSFSCSIMKCTLMVWVVVWQTSTALLWEASLNTGAHTTLTSGAHWLLSLVPGECCVNLPPALLYGFWLMLIDVPSLNR